MELDDMKRLVRARDGNRDRMALSFDRYHESRYGVLQRNLRALTRGQITQIVSGVLLSLFAAPYWLAHRDVLHLAVYGVLLHACGLMYIVLAARSIVLIQTIDYSQPVLTIQQRLADLAAWKVNVEWPLLALSGCFIWVPMVLMLIAGLGADLWISRPLQVGIFMAEGAAAAVVVLTLMSAMRRATADSAASNWAPKLRNSIVGRHVMQAQRQIDDAARFAAEPS